MDNQYISIDKQLHFNKNKKFAFLESINLNRIYYKNKKINKNYLIYFYFEKDEFFSLKDEKGNEIIHDKKINFIEFLSKITITTLIFFKNKQQITNYNFFSKVSRSDALFKYNETKIVDLETYLFLDENSLQEYDILEFYNTLKEKLSLENLYKYNSIFDYVINNGLKKIVNKVSFINKKLDLNFTKTFKPAWSEVFKLIENRNTRKIIAIDVNSMFPYCMNQENFTEINKMQKRILHNEFLQKEFLQLILDKKITNGISIVEMKLKDNLSENDIKFIESFNYFQINIDGNFYFFNNFKKKTFKMYLHNNEIEVFSKYFDFKILEIIYSTNSIPHYLSKTTNKFYEYRLNSNDKNEKNVIKTMLVAYHSITNKNLMKSYNKTFQNKTEAVNYFQNYLKIQFLNSWKNIVNFKGKKSKEIFISNTYENRNNTVTVLFKIPFIMNTTQIYSLPSQIMANSRITIFKFLEKVKEFNEKTNSKIEPCYTNIDSLHLSIEKENIDNFKKYFDNELNETELGKFKIEGIFDAGLWFDAGRYWLMNKEELKDNSKSYDVKLHKSSVFKDENNNWNTIKDIFIKDEFGSSIRRRHNLFYSTGYNKLFFKYSDTNIYLKKISIDKLISNNFNNFIKNLIIKNYNYKKNVFYYFKKKEKKEI